MTDDALAAKAENMALGPSAPMSSLLHLAITEKLDVDKLGKLVELQERLLDRQAAQEFAQAFARFRARCGPIRARHENEQFKITRNGQKASRLYADLEDIGRAVDPILAEEGLSYTFDSRTADGLISTTCTLRHIGGYAVSSSFACPTEMKSGANLQQQHSACYTYGRRNALVAVLGLTSTDEDTDGNDLAGLEPIDEETAADIERRLRELGADWGRFFAYMGVEDTREIRQGDLPKALAALDAKARDRAKAAQAQGGQGELV